MRAYKGDREGTVKNFGTGFPNTETCEVAMDTEFNRNNDAQSDDIVSSSIEQFTTPLVPACRTNPRNPCSMQNWKKPEGLFGSSFNQGPNCHRGVGSEIVGPMYIAGR